MQHLLFLISACFLPTGFAEQTGSSIHPYPLWPSEPHPGHPGLEVDENTTIEKLTTVEDRGEIYPAKYGQPEFLAYPGAVHHLRHFLQRYVPPYPLSNHNTLLKNFVLNQMPGFKDRCVDFAEPVYFTPRRGERIPTSRKRAPVKAFPWKRGSEPFKLGLGPLKRGVYHIRPIVAAPGATKAALGNKMVLFKLSINDLQDNKERMNAYIMRAAVIDNFYAVQKFFFHSFGDGRTFQADLSLLPESDCDLLLYNIDLHDHFGELARRRGKRRAVLGELVPLDRKKLEARWEKNRLDKKKWEGFAKRYPDLSSEEQRARDDELWQQRPPINMQPSGWEWYLQKTEKWTERFGLSPVPDEWKETWLKRDLPMFLDCASGKVYFDRSGRPHTEPSEKANETFTEKKIKPGIYYDVRKVQWGSGFSTGHGRDFPALRPYTNFGRKQVLRDVSMKFIRRVYDMPTQAAIHSIACIAGLEGLDRGLLKGGGHHNSDAAIRIYDALYDFLSTDQELATAAGRYLPWIRTPEDVIEFVDTYLVQEYANTIMKYRIYLDHEQARLMMTAVLVQNDNSISDPWMDFLANRGWEYPQSISGLAENLITGTGRDGGTTIGSFFYGLGGHTRTMGLMDKYMQFGGNSIYDFTDKRHFAKMREKPYFAIEGSACGRINAGVGDVGGIAEHYGRMAHMASVANLMRAGWRWFRDPKFAWELVHTFSRHVESDEEWAAIEAAAKECPRDPYLMNTSRVLTSLGGYLTSGVEHDDFRMRREVTVRVGTGFGHAHEDTLDLRLFAFGSGMVNDFNQRAAYGWPAHYSTRVHNLVEVDGQHWRSHSWIRNLFDAPGSPYMNAESVAPEHLKHVKLFRRQVAMIDVDEGRPSAKPEPQLDPAITLPSLYVFDVFRVSGGSLHTYCFHGCADDGFEANVKNMKKPQKGVEGPLERCLFPFQWTDSSGAKGGPIGGLPLNEKELFWSAECEGNNLVATWQLHPKAEKSMLSPGRKHGAAMTEGRKSTRLTLLDQQDNRIIHAIARARGGYGYYGRCLYAQKEAKGDASDLETVFVAFIEPFSGTPTITETKSLAIENNEADARRAVAVEVTTKKQTKDLLFADGRPDKVRIAKDSNGATHKFSGEFAFVRRDEKGLNQITLSGGTFLSGPDFELEVETPGYEARVTKVNYLDSIVSLKGKIPERLAGHYFEAGNDEHKTTCKVSTIKSRLFGRTELKLRKRMEIMRTHVLKADPATGKVIGSLAMFRHPGRDSGLTATNYDLTKLWRVSYSGGDRHAGHEFHLKHLDPKRTGPAFSVDEFPSGTGIRVWEFGPGDTFRISTGVSIRRTAKGAYDVYATSPFSLKIGDKSFHVDEKALSSGNRTRIQMTK